MRNAKYTMARSKYFYNKNTLRYERFKLTSQQKFARFAFGLLVIAVYTGFVFYLTPGKSDKLIAKELEQMKSRYNEMNYQVDLMSYKPQNKFDIILALGSINFGGRNKIIAEVSKCYNMLEDGGMMFFRVNPGVQHDKPEAKWIEFYAWNVPFIIELSEMFNLKVLDIRDDSNKRKYFVYRK